MVLVLGNIAFCDEAAKKAADALQGTWTTEKTIISGKELGTNEETVLVFEGEAVSWTGITRVGNSAKKSTIRFTFKLDPTKEPAAIDLIATEGFFKGKVFPSIYSLDGDTLKICRSQPETKRPTAFVSKEGSGHWLLTLNRSKQK